MNEEIDKIFKDKTSGSTDILYKVDKLILQNLDDKNTLQKILSELKTGLSQFRIVQSYIDRVERFLPHSGYQDEIIKILKDYLPVNEIYNSAKPYFKEVSRILTLSNSRIVTEFLKLFHKDVPGLLIYIAESRPLLEGRIPAAELLNDNIKVQLITDAQTGMFLPETDAVITGADKILKDGRIINKTGSLTTAVLCRHFKKPFYVLAQKEKYSDDLIVSQKAETPEQIWEEEHPGLVIKNMCFEAVDANLITKIFTN